MIPFAGLIVGALLGAVIGRDPLAVIAFAIVGLIVGFVIRSQRGPRTTSLSTDSAELVSGIPQMLQRLYALERRMQALEQRLVASGVPRLDATRSASAEPAAQVLTQAPESVVSGAETGAPSLPVAKAAASAATSSVDQAPSTTPAYFRPSGSVVPASTAVPASQPRPNPIWTWIVGGNMLARVGILVLLVGVGFLLKYATQHFNVPIALRLSGVAVGGMALLIAGWVLRQRRFAYAMVLQGGGVAVLYLTVFAALRLYALLSPGAAFALLAAIAALSGFLAVRQDALALAVIGVLGGFAAPILTATERGDHVILFSYYALLNAAIFGIAWFKAWRVLNLLGFACTFVVGTLWGVTRYRPENFWTTEPFLILFFLFYVGIAVAYALRRSLELRNPIDSALVFGTPLVAAGLQSALVRDFEYGLSFSAVGAAAVYLALGFLLVMRKQEALKLLCQSFLALGVVFATLAVPFAFDARWTSATWALEGAALVWIGFKQRRFAPRGFGLLLQLFAGSALLVGDHGAWTRAAASAYPVLNRDCLGALLLAVAGFATARRYGREPDGVSQDERVVIPVAFVWAALWWFGGAWREILRFVTPDYRVGAVVAFLSASALGFAALARVLRWPMARFATFAVFPALVVIAAGFCIWHSFPVDLQLFENGGWIAWPLAVVVMFALLRHYEGSQDRVDVAARAIGHALAFALVTLIAADVAAGIATSEQLGDAWQTAPWGLAPALALAIVSLPRVRSTWPVRASSNAYLALAGVPIVIALGLFSFFANLATDGAATPIAYLPLANPFDITQAIAIAAVVLWLIAAREEGRAFAGTLRMDTIAASLVAVVWWWFTMTLLRTIHQFAGVEWDPGALWHSMIAQAALSLLWTTFALAAMVVSYRRSLRAGWFAGLTLLIIVGVKLAFVDLSHRGTIAQIVSFIGVGLLLLLIAYLAPVPPRRKENAA